MHKHTPHAQHAPPVLLPTAAPTQLSVARRDALVVAVGLLALLLWDASGLDMAAVRLYGNESGFGLRDHWLTRGLLHEGGRLLAFVGLLLLVVNLYRPLWRGPTLRERVWWLGVTLACLAIPPLLKQASLSSCPWSLAEFGGVARHVSHWRFGVADGGPGGCFPSGHATAAAGFLGGWFVLRRHQPAAARGWLVALLALTLLYGWAQMARGAHYPSHTLWSAWLCWAFAWAMQTFSRP